MDVTQTTNSTARSAQNKPASPNPAASKPALSSDFETFLKMLTAQMKNQDPLNPVDSADYAVQLATFSSVEQQVKTNDLLTQMQKALSGSGLSTLGQWVGLEARGGSTARYSGKPLDLHLPEKNEADRRILLVNAPDGTIVSRLDVPLTGQDFTWDGKLANGQTIEPGTYAFAVEFMKKGETLSREKVKTYSLITEARMNNGKTELVLQSGEALDSVSATALRRPK